MNMREIKKRIKECSARTNENMENQKKIADGICPSCGSSLGKGRYIGTDYYFCAVCRSHFLKIPNIDLKGQLEIAKFFVMDVRKMLESEQRRIGQLEPQHV